jgi:ethanolamine-phosphate cytidylyltransferase
MRNVGETNQQALASIISKKVECEAVQGSNILSPTPSKAPHRLLLNMSNNIQHTMTHTMDGAPVKGPMSFMSNLITQFWVQTDEFIDSCTSSTTIKTMVTELNMVLTKVGVPHKSLATEEELCLFLFAVSVTLFLYYIWFGKRHVRRRRRLAAELNSAQSKIHYLEEKLLLAESDIRALEDRRGGRLQSPKRGGRRERPIRIFMDGAFDMMHYGHMNAFRLGRSLGTELIVGVNSDESITKCKGPPLLNDSERMTMVSNCKFVDEVVPDCPYVMSREYLDFIIEKYEIDYVIHGDDPCIVDGKDVYETAKASGKFRSIPRTEGVSTTDIVGRMLLMTTEHHCRKQNKEGEDFDANASEMHQLHAATLRGSMSNLNNTDQSTTSAVSMLGQTSKFITTSRLLRLFSGGMQNPANESKVIYMDGAWDMFHPGHVAILKAAKARGDYLIVGVHGDTVVNHHRGMNLPLMNLHERVLSVLGCQFVDDVVIDAPYVITEDLVASLHIAEVVHGDKNDYYSIEEEENGSVEQKSEADRQQGSKLQVELLCFVF